MRLPSGRDFSRVAGADLLRAMGSSEAIEEIVERVGVVARSDFTVIITGETGSGKELVARAIHDASHRAQGPFVAVDCGAIPEALLESELFGYERGAFTGAVGRKPGKFESARNGTLFLDEISNLTLGSQAKLLRALQEKTVWRVGGTEPFEVDVRVLVAANQALGAGNRGESFRRDLYYRLNEFTIRIPPLRDRKSDILYLAHRFLDLTNHELGKNLRGFDQGAIEALLAHDWPGNVRELRSAVRRAVLVGDEIITARQFDFAKTADEQDQPAVEDLGTPWDGRSLKEIVREKTEEIEREVLSTVLRRTGGNKAKAARLLSIDYKTIQTKIKNLGIKVEGV